MNSVAKLILLEKADKKGNSNEIHTAKRGAIEDDRCTCPNWIHEFGYACLDEQVETSLQECFDFI
jgi:hypothetical protein